MSFLYFCNCGFASLSILIWYSYMVFIQIESSISRQIMRDFSIEFFTKNYHWNKKCCFKFQCRRNICRHKRTFILRSWDNCRSVVKAARDVGKYMTKTKSTRWGARTLDHRIKSPALYQTELTGLSHANSRKQCDKFRRQMLFGKECKEKRQRKTEACLQLFK